MAATLLQFTICMVSLGFTLAKTYDLDDTYCKTNKGTTFKTINLGDKESANMTYGGIKTYGDDCLINFQGGEGYLYEKYQMCVEAIAFNINCTVTVRYYSFVLYIGYPDMTFSCTDEIPWKHCFNETSILIAIDASSQTQSEVVLNITAHNLKIPKTTPVPKTTPAPPIGDVSGLKPTLLPLMLAGLFIISKKLV